MQNLWSPFVRISCYDQKLRWKNYKFHGVRGTLVKKVVYFLPDDIQLDKSIKSREVEVSKPTDFNDPE